MKHRKPLSTPIGRGPNTNKLYNLEEKRNEAIKKAAAELGKVLGFDEGQFWTHTVPEEMFSILDSFERKACELAAVAFLESHGYKVEKVNKEED